MIREAKFADILRIRELLEEGRDRSKYADCKIDKENIKLLCMEAIRSGNGCLFVSEVNGVVEGFIIGGIENLYLIFKEKQATDLLFLVSERDSKGAIGLLNNFIVWAESKPEVVSITLGVTDVIGDFERVAKLYGRKGFKQVGGIYEKRMTS